MIRFFDASALVKRYVKEEDSDAVRRLLRRGTPAISRLSVVEIASAFARRCREGDLSSEERDRAIAAFARDTRQLLVVELSRAVVDGAVALALEHPLRASDAIQLASCLTLRARAGRGVRFLAFDRGLNRTAKAEGLRLMVAAGEDGT